MLLLVLCEGFQNEALVVGIEHLKTRLYIVYLVFGLYGLLARIELHQGTVFVSDKDHFANSAEVTKDIVHAVMVKIFRQGPHKQHL